LTSWERSTATSEDQPTILFLLPHIPCWRRSLFWFSRRFFRHKPFTVSGIWLELRTFLAELGTLPVAAENGVLWRLLPGTFFTVPHVKSTSAGQDSVAGTPRQALNVDAPQPIFQL